MYAKFFKRVLDFSLSLLALIVLSPILLILMIVGAIAMRGNPFFTQMRPGKINKKTGKEKIFKLIKFRTMTNAKDKDGNLLPDEKRLIKYGKILRSTSLDELPELLNIIKGDMALVGPRPQLVRDMVFMTDTQRARHQVRPGLTGLAQVNGRNATDWDTRLQQDVYYVDHISAAMDIKVFLRDIKNRIKNNGFLEYAEFVGNYYGTPLDKVEKQLSEGNEVVLEIEVQGALQVMEKCKDALEREFYIKMTKNIVKLKDDKCV